MSKNGLAFFELVLVLARFERDTKGKQPILFRHLTLLIVHVRYPVRTSADTCLALGGVSL